jgi:hypothetical protein
MNLPSDLERLINFMKTIGWIPKEPEYVNGTFIVKLERTKSAKMHIEYDDYWEEPEDEDN